MTKKNVYLFFGEDSYSANKKARFWREQFKKKHGGDINITELEGKQTTAIQFESDVYSTPFLADKRLIVIYDFLSKAKKEEQKKVADILEGEIPDFCVIVFVENKPPDKRMALYKKINKVGNIEEFNLLMGPQLTSWISQRAKAKNLELSPALADYLGKIAGSDLWNLDNEIEKIKMYSQTSNINKESIEKLIHPNLTASIFKLTDFLAQKNPKDSLVTLHVLIESGEDIIKILFMIVRHFRILIQVKDLIERESKKSEITSKLKMHPYVITKTIQQCPNFSKEKLFKVYNQLLQIDIDVKTGKIKMLSNDKKEMLLALEQFIFSVCK